MGRGARGGVLFCERGEARRVYWDVELVIGKDCGVDGATGLMITVLVEVRPLVSWGGSAGRC